MRPQHQHTTQYFRNRRIGVLMGGLSLERDVSLRSGAAMAEALQRLGYAVTVIDVDGGLVNALAAYRIEIAVLALHGQLGEDGTVQGLLEVLGIPYTGSGVRASAVAMHKAAAKKIFTCHGLPTPAFEVLSMQDSDAAAAAECIRLARPFVVKPCEGGSSLGTSIVHEEAEIVPALHAALSGSSGEVLVESYVAGRELTVGVLDGRALPVIEVRPGNGFYDFSAKYEKGATSYIACPELPDGLHGQLQQLAESAYSALGCSGAARVDCMLDSGSAPFILEINTIPGMTETSLLPMAAQQAGMGFDELVERIMQGAALHTRAERSAKA